MAKRNNLRLLHQGKICNFVKTLWHNQCMLCNSSRHFPVHIWSAPNREDEIIFWIQQYVCSQQTIKPCSKKQMTGKHGTKAYSISRNVLTLKKIIMHSKIHLFRQSMYNRRHCYPYESINSAQQKPEKCNSIRCSLAPPSHSGSLRTNVSFSVHQIIKTPQEFVHYSSWLEKAFWWGKHTATFQKTFSSIELPSPITQKSWWF